MRDFKVMVNTGKVRHTYKAVGLASIDVYLAALDRFGVCAVSVIPAGPRFAVRRHFPKYR